MNTEHKVIEVVGGIIRRGDKYLLGKRPLGKSLGTRASERRSRTPTPTGRST